LLGVGVGNFQVLEPSYALLSINLSDIRLILDDPKVAHNTYLHVLVELGIIGLVCFTVIVLGAFLGGLRALKGLRTSGDRQTEILVRGVLIGMTGMLAAYTFISGQSEKQLWLGLGIMLSLSAVARAARARDPEPLRLGVSPSSAPPR
jgi:O-antigen ligase